MIDRYSSLRHGLVGAWCPALGATGRLLTDYSPYRRNATISGTPVWAARGVDLSAASTFAEIPHSSIYDITTSGISVSAWFTTTTTALNFADVIVSKAQLTGAQIQFQWQGNSTGAIIFAISTTVSGSNSFNTVAVSGLAVNVLYHVVGTLDSVGLMTSYLNGKPFATTTISGSLASTNNTQPIRISDHAANLSRQWPGTIDDVRVYNRCLSADECRLLATRPGVGLQPQRQRRFRKIGNQWFINVGGTWKKADAFVKVSGTWKQATPSRNVSGTWK